MVDKSTDLQLESCHCPLCGSERQRTVIRTSDELLNLPGTYSINRCAECGHRFLNPRPTPETIRLCYPQNYGPHQTAAISTTEVRDKHARPWYLKYLPLRFIPGLRRLYDWLLDSRSQILPQHPLTGSPELLELGCATGLYLKRVQDEGWKVQGVEPSENAASKARQSGLNVSCGLLENTDFNNASFDAVALWMVLEHVFQPNETLTHLHRLLKPGGQLLLSVPNAGCWEPLIFRSAWYAWEPPRHLHHFSPRTVTETLQQAGFDHIKIIHQRNLSNVIGSFGIVLKRLGMTSLGESVLNYPNNPRTWVQLLLAPWAIFFSVCRQGGRLTVTATRPLENDQP